MPTTTIRRTKTDPRAVQTRGQETSQIKTQESSDKPKIRGTERSEE